MHLSVFNQLFIHLTRSNEIHHLESNDADLLPIGKKLAVYILFQLKESKAKHRNTYLSIPSNEAG